MPLNRKQLHEALRDACQDESELRVLLTNIDRKWADYVAPNTLLPEAISLVIEKAVAQNWLSDFLQATATCEWKDNPKIVAFFMDHPEYDPHAAARKPNPVSSLTDADKLFRVVRERLPSHLAQIRMNQPDDLQPYNRVFRHIVDETWSASENLLLSLAEQVQDVGSRYPLRILGQPGSGKSTLLSLLYFILEFQHQSRLRTSAVPFLIDLSWFSTTEPDRTLSEIDNYLSNLSEYLGSRPGSTAVLLVDGLEEYAVNSELLQEHLASFLRRSPAVRKVVAVGIPFDREAYTNSPRLADGNPRRSLTLSAVPVNTAQKFVLDYMELQRRERSAASRTVQIVKQIRLDDVDLQTLALLEEKLPRVLGESEGTTDQYRLVAPYHHIRNLSDFYVVLCRERLGGKQHITETAELAFRATMTSGGAQPEQFSTHTGWRLVHWHLAIRNFLVAWHVIKQLDSPHLNEQELDALNFVYPKQTTHFCRELVSNSKGKEAEFIRGVEAHFPGAKSKLRSHMAYLLGRVRFHQQWARQILRKWNSEADGIAERPGATGHDLLFARSVHISLAYLGDPGAQSNYIARLLTDRRWNSLNRGFHLEYYGDISWNPRDPEGLMVHEDHGEAWSTTREALLDKLERKDANSVYQIDLFTIVSLAQRRLGTDFLSDSDRTRIKVLAEEAVRMPIVRSDAFRDYLLAMSWQFKAPQFSPISVIDALYRLKTVPRRGWIRCNLPVSEMVASHSFSAVLLASVLLPNETGSPSYNKQTILQMLFSHDLAESITGDTLPSEDVPAAREREARAYRLLGSCATHEGVEQLAEWERLYSVFTAETEENAKIARDFDRLDNLVQLICFRPHFSDEQTYAAFYADVHGKIKTPEGLRCRDLVVDYFQNRNKFAGWLDDLNAWAESTRRSDQNRT